MPEGIIPEVVLWPLQTHRYRERGVGTNTVVQTTTRKSQVTGIAIDR